MKIIMGLSGGMDSTTVLGLLRDMGHEVHTLNFTYGSKHNEYECAAAQKVADFYEVPYQLIDMTIPFRLMSSNLLKTGNDIPEGHYEQDNMSQTVVPGRNTIFAAVMMGYAESIGASHIALGIHLGDHQIYPDCRREYFKALDSTIYLATDRKVELLAPFQETDKYGIIKTGLEIDVPYHLSRTCYKNQLVSCGRCSSCVERLEAWYKHDIEDPIEYEDREFFKTQLGL